MRDKFYNHRVHPLRPPSLQCLVKAANAFGGEVLCTFFLVINVFAATDGEMNRKLKHTGALLPLSIGMAVLLGKISAEALGCGLR